MTKKQKLELTWIGKEQRPRLEPRILLEDDARSYHAEHLISDLDIFDNKLIFGDNLLALKALEQEYSGKVKCVFIDPPYNTGSAFTHYDDGIEHSLWLGLMRDRLEILRNLLSNNGSIWITIDDNEAHYLKVLCDEVFGRTNFIANIIWQKKYAPSNDAIYVSQDHDHILVFSKSKAACNLNRLPRNAESNSAYKNPDNDRRGLWRADNYKCNKTSDERPNLYYPIIQPNTGKEIWPLKTAVWRYNQETHQRHITENRIWWGKTGLNDVPAFKRFLKDVEDVGQPPSSIWDWRSVGHNQDAKKEQQSLNATDPFSTPKPELLLQRILTIATNPGDLVLDSFAGSGTTGSVAHKMGRRWIMVELGEHCHSHIIPRLRKIIDGEDKGGATEATGWLGGGGFRYYSLASSLLEKDKWGNWVICKEYNAIQLSQALCKLEGFTYSPSDVIYWQQGYSTERDFIYVTTQNLTSQQLQVLNDDVGLERSLLVLCSAFKGNPDRFPNLTVKKIPRAVLFKCEWGHDDYSLNVQNLPMAEREEELPKSKSIKSKQPTLFDVPEDRK